jgi:hypothetical protein
MHGLAVSFVTFARIVLLDSFFARNAAQSLFEHFRMNGV